MEGIGAFISFLLWVAIALAVVVLAGVVVVVGVKFGWFWAMTPVAAILGVVYRLVKD